MTLASLRARTNQLIFRHRDARIGQRRSPDGAKMIEVHHEAVPRTNIVKISDRFVGAALAFLRALAVARVQQSNVGGAVRFARHGRAHARIHASTQQHHRFARVAHSKL